MAVRKGSSKKAKASPGRKKAAKKKPAAKKKAPSATTGEKKTTARKPAGKTAGSMKKKAAAATRPMTPAKRKDALKEILLRKRNEVVQGLEQQIGRKLTFEPGQRLDSAMDSADQSAFDMNEGIDYSLIEMKYGQYKDIADAFRKLQNDTYGQCEECGEEIDIKRMTVNPLARFCIACKTRKEELEKIQKEETRFKE
ncbi:MAG TPA: hypothetical protein DCS05_00605 [Nitrospiraceae bacterium]|jgi:DnaK suppressor protein|nr:hypothetical protein [Nitrospiraceae bacterium]